MDKNKIFFSLTFLLLIAGYSVFNTPLLNCDGIWINDEGNRMLSIAAWAENDSPALSDPLRNCSDISEAQLRSYASPYFVRDGQSWISAYTPFFPRFFSFFHWNGTYFGVRLAVLLCGIGTALATWFAGTELELTAKQKMFAVLLTGFGTPLLFYSGVLLEITTATLIAALFLILLLRSLRAANPFSFVLAGLLAGSIGYFREEGYILLAAATAALLFIRRPFREILLFTVPAFLTVLPLWLYNWNESATIFGLHHKIYTGLTQSQTIPERLYSVFFFLFQGNAPESLLRNACAGIFLIALLYGFLPERIRNISGLQKILLFLILAAASVNFAALFFWKTPFMEMLSAQSLFATVPFVILPFFFFRDLSVKREKPFQFILLFCILSIIGIAICLNAKTPGIFWGPRHFVLILPTAALLCSEIFHFETPAWNRKYALLFMAVLSIASQSFGEYALHRKKAYSEQIVEQVRTSDATLIASSVFWMREELASVRNKPILCMSSATDALPAIKNLAAANGISSILLLVEPKEISREALEKSDQIFRFGDQSMTPFSFMRVELQIQ